MIKTLNPYSNTEKTAEIMSRYRPIAPKPEGPLNSIPDNNSNNNSLSPNINQSPYLRNIWPQLQARPTRTRKRGRASLSGMPPSGFKRSKLHQNQQQQQQQHHLSFQGFTHGIPVTNFVPFNCTLEPPLLTQSYTPPPPSSSLVTLPLLPCSPSVLPVLTAITNNMNRQEMSTGICMEGEMVKGIDLNRMAEIPEEKDLLQQLQRLPFAGNVIAPQPVRPVGSTINVGCINEDPSLYSTVELLPKRPEEVEEEVECDAFPAVISDSNHKVRLANSAYKEMVGQPECSWLEAMVNSGDGKIGGCKRICGEVMLHLCDSDVPVSSNGFSCWVRIEWGSNNNDKVKNNCITAFCDVIRLACESKDYLFTWRFHINTITREASQSSSNL